MSFSVDVWIYADADASRLAELLCDILQAVHLGFAFYIYHQDFIFQRKFKLVVALAHAA